MLSKTKAKGIKSTLISDIIKAKYKKLSSKYLTLEEAKDLDNNFDNYIAELEAPTKQELYLQGEAFALQHEDAGDRI